jgi:DNA topoisomerase-1
VLALTKAGCRGKKHGFEVRSRSNTVAMALKRSVGNKLVIVESPTKAKTISQYLGKGYTVKASMGHIRDLPRSKLGVDVDKGCQAQYLVPREKRAVVKELKELVEKAATIYLATDPDREGEAIAWHVVQATQAKNGKEVLRIAFHEITEEAIREALASPREIDLRLVTAQQARRVLDRLVGYLLSPLLWRKVRGRLSAGRVQSAALRMIVDREREIQAFVPQEYWTLGAHLSKAGDKRMFWAYLVAVGGEKASIPDAARASELVELLRDAPYSVQDVKRRQVQRKPGPPFITSTLQQEAARKLGFTAQRTMRVAQQLYEGVELGTEGSVGLITYMRTDSTQVSAKAQEEARQVILEKFGAPFLPERPPVYAKKVKGAQEAHEAIRPTSSRRTPESVKQYLSQDQYRLYKLIWERFIASQMSPAQLEQTSVDILALPEGGKEHIFRATGSVVIFPGFLAIYREGTEDEEGEEKERQPLPPLENGDRLKLHELRPDQHFTQPPPRYTDAGLIKAMEEAGIGRPSTYAVILSTLQERGYVVRQEKRLVPTELGMVVNDLLVAHFPEIVDTAFTSKMEEELDDIAAGEREYVPVLQEFYGPFSSRLAAAEVAIPKVELQDELAGENCELCGRPMVIKTGRYGKFIACSGYPECRNSKPYLVKLGIPCPKCGQGELVERRARSGRTFWSCSLYPECDFSVFQRPSESPCPKCGGLTVRAGARKLRCTRCGHIFSDLAKTA